MTIDQPAPTSPSGTGGIAVRFALAFVSGLVLVIAIGGGALYAYGQQYTGKVLPGVSVGDVDLSGLSPEEARAQLESTYGTFGDGTITLTGPDGDVTVGYDEIGREPDIDAMVAGRAHRRPAGRDDGRPAGRAPDGPPRHHADARRAL